MLPPGPRESDSAQSPDVSIFNTEQAAGPQHRDYGLDSAPAQTGPQPGRMAVTDGTQWSIPFGWCGEGSGQTPARPWADPPSSSRRSAAEASTDRETKLPASGSWCMMIIRTSGENRARLNYCIFPIVVDIHLSFHFLRKRKNRKRNPITFQMAINLCAVVGQTLCCKVK